MHYIVIGRDGDDDNALARRMAARAKHIEVGDTMIAAGNLLLAVALLDDNGKMCGSVLLCEFPDRQALDTWLIEEPYVTGDVWREIEIKECRVGPSFQAILQTMKHGAV
jgi:uncharacterized protein